MHNLKVNNSEYKELDLRFSQRRAKKCFAVWDITLHNRIKVILAQFCLAFGSWFESFSTLKVKAMYSPEASVEFKKYITLNPKR
jgi:hypothetical protein